MFLGFNELAGPIPAELGNLSNLETLYLGFNELAGPIPGEVGNLSNLESLYLSHNRLTGTISGELGSLSNLLLQAGDQGGVAPRLPLLNLAGVHLTVKAAEYRITLPDEELLAEELDRTRQGIELRGSIRSLTSIISEMRWYPKTKQLAKRESSS